MTSRVTKIKTARRAAVDLGPRAARLGGPGVSLPLPFDDSSTPPKSLSRSAERGLHAAHRKHSKHTRKTGRKWKRLTEVERREKARLGRRERHKRRSQLQQVTTLPSVRRCGVARARRRDKSGQVIESAVSLRVKEGEGGSRTAGYGGLQHCGSVWACPVCGATVATRRARELAKLLKWALEQGYSASMMTLTMRHHAGQKLKPMWDALAAGWKAATGGRKWVREQALFGLEGWVKAVEATHGENGWHIHLHVLMIWNRPDDGEEDEGGKTEVQRSADLLAQLMHGRWTAALKKRGFDSWAESGGLDVRMASLDPDANGLHDYFTKMAFEVTGGSMKQAKGKGRTPFQILADAFTDGLADDFELWWEWEEASKKRKQLAWSKGLKDRAGINDVSDEEVANEEVAADEAIDLSYAAWCELVKRGLTVELLEVAEDGGLDAACAWLTERHLLWGKRRTVARGDP